MKAERQLIVRASIEIKHEALILSSQGVIGKVVTAPFVANSRQRGRCASALAVPTSTRLASRGYISPCSVSDNKSDYTRITLK